MKLSSLIVKKPICFSILLALFVLVLPSLWIPCWYNILRINYYVRMNSYTSRSKLQSEIEKTAKLLQPLNSSTMNLARVLTSSLNGTEKSFSEIETKVAPLLFEGYSTIPYLSQISYIRSDGLFFSYYTGGNQSFTTYSNSTLNVWYTQPVNNDTGKLYGNVTARSPLVTANSRWFLAALNSSNGYASLGTKWDNARDLLFLCTNRVNKSNGVVSLGFSVKMLAEFFMSIKRRGGSLHLATQDGQVIVEGMKNTKVFVSGTSVSFQLLKPNGDQLGHIRNISCKPTDDVNKDIASILEIQGTEYMIYCSPLEILGVQSVYVVAFPEDGLSNLVRKSGRVTVTLLIVMIVITMITVLSFVCVIVRYANIEMSLSAKLIRQKESTEQAERKSMKKSNAFANASHDIRAALAGISGLIEISYEEVAPASELETNLKQMESCTKDLLGLLNTILDISKIEAGKMQLEVEEFDLSQLLEDVVDLYHPAGMKKGIDVILDPHDGSVIKYSKVKGDRGKLKQVLCNLLSNAVKFTEEGHATVRGWAKKASFQDEIIASNKNGKKSEEGDDGIEAAMDGVDEEDPNWMEFVFEVDDSGKGIPKEKRESVFENYVQVKETALGQGGTGLGLGIVQSLVRLMHGDISIVDKEIGERGTCFRFNVILNVCDNVLTENQKGDNDVGDDLGHSPRLTIRKPNAGLTGHSSSPRLNIRSHSPRLAIRTSSPRVESSRIVLMIQDYQRRTICKKFMESLGLKVSVVKYWEQLPNILKRITDKQNHSHHSSKGRSEVSSPTDSLSTSTSLNSTVGVKDVPLSTMDETNHVLSVFKKTNIVRGSSRFILIVIDASSGPFKETYQMITEFRKSVQNIYCKVVWLDKPLSRRVNVKEFEEENLYPNDIIITKPFHGTRLYQVVRLLPEFGGTFEAESNDPKTSKSSVYQAGGNSPTYNGSQIQGVGQQETRNQEIEEEYGESSSGMPLSGKKVLVAEDNALLRKVAENNVRKLGASVEVCLNGEEAVQMVRKGFDEQRKYGTENVLPYDYILMDCEMPIMDGFEATRKIRKIEKYRGVKIPIIALTAHTIEEEVKRMIEAGMDVHLSKPLKKEHLMEAIKYIHCI